MRLVKKIVLLSLLLSSIFICSSQALGSSSSYLSLAKEAERQGKFSVAIKWFRKALSVVTSPDLRVKILGAVQKVLQNLLKEEAPIRDLVTILETLADCASVTKDPGPLTEHVRQRLGRSIVKQHEPDGSLYVATLDHKLEKLIEDSVQETSFIHVTACAISTDQKHITGDFGGF